MDQQLLMPSPPVDFNFESTSTSPYATAPSSPKISFPSFYYSAPTSPTSSVYDGSPINSHAADDFRSTEPFARCDQNREQKNEDYEEDDADFAFDFSGQLERPSISDADELFHAGKIKALEPPPPLLKSPIYSEKYCKPFSEDQFKNPSGREKTTTTTTSVRLDFITKLPKTPRGYDSIWVVVDRLTKSAQFIPIRESFSVEKLAHIYIKEVVRYHGVPRSIVSDRDSRFTSRFWQSFQNQMGSKILMSTAYHPQTDGQSERTIQTLEDMLRACIIDFGGSWDDHLPLVEFSYNNSYHSSIQMAPYEALYGTPCLTPTCWTEAGEKPLAGPEIVEQTEAKIKMIREQLKIAQNRQKQYADRRRKPIEFQVGDMVMLKVSPWKGIIRFGKRGKLSPRFIGPFRIVKRVGAVAYQLELPEELTGIHNVFHVSCLRKTLFDETKVIPLEEVKVDDKLQYPEQPEKILDRKEKLLRNKRIGLVKVQWRHHRGTDVTWEPEADFRAKYPHLFLS